MKNVPQFVVVLIFIVIFCAGFIGAAKLSIFYSENRNFEPVENNPNPYFWVMVFTGDNVQTIFWKDLEDFKKEHSAYSFLVPKGKEDYYNQKLANAYYKPSFGFNVKQLSADRQLIKLTSGGGKSSGTDIYEATDKEIFPKATLELDLKDAFLMLVVGLTGGTLASFIFLLIYKKHLIR